MAIGRLPGFLLVSVLSYCQNAQQEAGTAVLKANAVMAQVAANQDRSEVLRKECVYKQHIHIVSRKPNGRMMREETADYDVVPMPNGTQKQLRFLAGRYWNRGKYVDFQGEPVPLADSVDADLIHDFRNDLLNDKSKDGMARGLFPLTSEEQRSYAFELLGNEVEGDRSVYRIAFKPKNKEEFTWAGEAFIDSAEFQPIRVFTKLSRRVPFMVRTTMGTDLPGIGFNVTYKRQADGVWFPSTFGTEFRLHVLFFLNRNVSVSLENTGFQHTHVETKTTVVESVE